jgi:hypothetical protein
MKCDCNRRESDYSGIEASSNQLVKLKHWRAFSRIFGRNTAPVLDFGFYHDMTHSRWQAAIPALALDGRLLLLLYCRVICMSTDHHA